MKRWMTRKERIEYNKKIIFGYLEEEFEPAPEWFAENRHKVEDILRDIPNINRLMSILDRFLMLPEKKLLEEDIHRCNTTIVVLLHCYHIAEMLRICKAEIEALRTENKRLKHLLRRSLLNLKAQGSGGFIGILANEIEAALQEE